MPQAQDPKKGSKLNVRLDALIQVGMASSRDDFSETAKKSIRKLEDEAFEAFLAMRSKFIVQDRQELDKFTVLFF